MKIILKKNNSPVKPGYYLRETSRTPIAAVKIEKEGKDLMAVTGVSVFSLNHRTEKDNYWSDVLEIEVEK